MSDEQFEHGVKQLALFICKKYKIPDMDQLISKTISSYQNEIKNKNGKCPYKPSRGRFANRICNADVVPGTNWCSKHPNGMSALQARKTQSTKNIIQKVEKPKVVCNKFGNWVHPEYNLVFENETSNKIIGYQDRRIVNTQLDAKQLQICQQHGWKVKKTSQKITSNFNLRHLKQFFSPENIDDIQQQIDQHLETLVYRRMTMDQICEKICEIEKVKKGKMYLVYEPYDDVFYWSNDKVQLIQIKIDKHGNFEISEWSQYENGFDTEMIKLKNDF